MKSRERTAGGEGFLFSIHSLICVHQRFLKFCIVGGTGTLLHFSILYLLTEFVGILYVFSAAVAVIAASSSNYTLNHIWTFKQPVKNHVIGWTKYQSTGLITDVLYLIILAVLVEMIGLWYVLGAILSLVTVAPIRFIIVSKWIWGRPKTLE